MASTPRHALRATLRAGSSISEEESHVVYILVMGLTGAGKSTFISIATEDDTIGVGEDDDMDGVTQDVEDYVLDYTYGSVKYEVHLIDSPGFDDGTANDAEVLSRIATYVNNIFKMNQTIAGVLYLHDITKAKMGGVGIRNLRMLEKMVGVEEWHHCTLVTTKWGCTDNPAGEEKREQRLKNDDKYFKAMCESSKHARMARFERSKGSALNIIKPHLGRKFKPAISLQMVDPTGPRLALGDTDAGRIVRDNLEQLLLANKMFEEADKARKILEKKFDEKLFGEFKQKRDSLLKQHNLNRAGRWIVRFAIVGGGIAATVVTLGPGASAFVLEPAFEKYARSQKRSEREQLAQLRADYQDQSQVSQKLSHHGGDWLGNNRVKEMRQLDAEEYSLISSSRTSLHGDDDEKERRRDDGSSIATTESSHTAETRVTRKA